MMKRLLLVCALLVGASGPSAAKPRHPKGAHAPGCCRVCTKGCPCGDSCISCSKTCHQGPGCACAGR